MRVNVTKFSKLQVMAIGAHYSKTYKFQNYNSIYLYLIILSIPNIVTKAYFQRL